MAWTSPRTWTTGEVVTAALMNTHLRDNLKAVGDSWVTTGWTPAFAGTGSALGNGTLVGSWMRVGKFTGARARLTFGSTTTMGSSGQNISLPATHAGTGGATSSSWLVKVVRSGVPRWIVGQVTSSAFYLYADLAGAAVTATVPITWTTGDIVEFECWYEAT